MQKMTGWESGGSSAGLLAGEDRGFAVRSVAYLQSTGLSVAEACTAVSAEFGSTPEGIRELLQPTD